MTDLDHREEQVAAVGGIPGVCLSSEPTENSAETTPPTSQPEGRPGSPVPKIERKNQTDASGQLFFSWWLDGAESRVEPANPMPEVDGTSDYHSVQVSGTVSDAVPAVRQRDSSGSQLVPEGVDAVSEVSDKIAVIDTGFGPVSHDGDVVFADGDRASARVRPKGSASLGMGLDYSHEPSLVVISEEVDGVNSPSNEAATEADKPTDTALHDANDGPSALEENTGVGVNEAGANVPAAGESQTAGALPTAEGSEHEDLSKQIEKDVAPPTQRNEVPAPHTGKRRATRKSNPTVITEERDWLGQSEREILDRLKELSLVQRESFPNLLPDEVQAGASKLLTEHATCTKTVYRTITKLIEKGFIDIVPTENQEEAGTGTKYRIVPDSEVKGRRLARGLTHWVQIGLSHKAVPDPNENEEEDD